MTDELNDNSRHDEARKHAWSWFTLHADQRLKSVNFYLILLAFLSAGFVTAHKEKLFGVGAVVSLFAIFTTYLFYQMDRRNRSLVKTAENALKPFENQLARNTNNDAVRLIESSDENARGEWTYTRIFRCLYLAAFILFTLGFLYSVWFAFQTPTNEFALKVGTQGISGVFLCFLGLELISLEKLSQDKATSNIPSILFWMGVVALAVGIVALANLVFFRMW